ncbi:MAG TPA: DinB family protein [Pyrinomonadaceae bacterium]|nr:DinB family protein [Pyrinomonadaceae bacterium]
MTVSRRSWVEREFTLGLPAWMFPNVIERLRGTPARVAEMTRGLAPEVLSRRDGERWSIQEHVGHLLDLGWLDLARVEDFEAGREVLTAADMTNRKTHEADHNSRDFADVLARFHAERADFVRRLEAFDEEAVARTSLHPRIKRPMRPADFAYFVAEHDDHHLAAISELIRKFAS